LEGPPGRGGPTGPVLVHVRDAERFYRLPLKAPWAHIALTGALLWLLVFLIPKVWRHFEAQRLSLNPTLENVQQAIALEPDRAEYRYQLGRIYLFSLTSYDPQLAIQPLRRAVELNPSVAEYWLDLASAYDSLGKKAEAVECVETARRHDPRNPHLSWATGNIRAEAGEVPLALEAWRDAILEQPDQMGLGLDLAWRLAPDTQLLLDHLVPPNTDADLRFLEFLIHGNFGEPALVWNRIVARGQPFPPRLAERYFHNFLVPDPDPAVLHRNMEVGTKSWSEMVHLLASGSASPVQDGGSSAGRAPGASIGHTDGNLVNNSGFELEMLNIGFDWTWDAPKGASLRLDETVFKEGRRSARIDFDGSENLVYCGLHQYIPVSPGHRYRLDSFLRAERIKGGAGIRLEIGGISNHFDAEPHAHGREVFDTSTWVADSFEFTVPAATYLVLLRVQRAVGTQQSKVAGSFWLDNVVLRDVESSTGDSPQRGVPQRGAR
jgi:hypothetical protein